MADRQNDVIKQDKPAKVDEPQVVTDVDDASPDNPIKLRKPILINGVERKELTWTDEIGPDEFLKADSLAHGGRASFSVAELDSGFHFWLGAMMVCAANPEIDSKDLEQIRGRDLLSVMRIGRFFMTGSDKD